MQFCPSMSHFVHTFLTSHYRALELPEEFASLKEECHKGPVFVVLPRQSILLETMLQAMLAKCDLPAAEPVTAGLEPRRGGIYFAGFNSTKRLQIILDYLNAHQHSHTASLRVFGVLRDRGPIRSNPQYLMSWVGSLFLIIAPFLRLRRPVLLLTPTAGITLRRSRSVARFRALCRSLYLREVRVVRGVPFEDPERIVSHTLTGKEFTEQLTRCALSGGLSEAGAHRRVRRELLRIIARPRTWAYIPAAFLAELLVGRLFTKVKTAGLSHLRRASKDGTPVIVPLHRSHLDYVVISLAMYKANFLPPLIAAGVNLNFWPFGPIARSLGAFFVRRGSHNAALHRLALESYLKYLIHRGHSLKFYIEGGRSRSGKMRAPRLGMLSTIVEAARETHARDVWILPTTVSYERVIEDSSLAAENAGKRKTRENLYSLLRAHRFLRKSYGEVEVRFGEPLSLREFLSRTKDGEDIQAKLPELGRTVVQGIRRGTALTQATLETTALLTAPNYGLTAHELRERVTTLASLAEVVNKAVPSFATKSENLNRFLVDAEQEPSLSEAVIRTSFLNSPTLYIPGAKRYQAEFYKNAGLHIFSHLSLLAVEQLTRGSFSAEDVATLYPFLQYDLQLPSLDAYCLESALIIRECVRVGLITEANQDKRFLFKEQRPGIFNALLFLPQIEALALLLCKLRHLSSHRESQEIPLHMLSTSFQSEVAAGKYLGVVSRTESGAQSTFDILLPSLEQMGIVKRNFEHGKLQGVIVVREGDEERVVLLERLIVLGEHERTLRTNAMREHFS